MDAVKVAVRAKLLGREQLVAMVNDRVIPSRSAAGENPIHPLITLGHSGGANSDGFSADHELRVDVWSKLDNDELWLIYQEVREALHKQPLTINGVAAFLCRETWVNDDLYEPATKTHHLSAKFKLITRG